MGDYPAPDLGAIRSASGVTHISLGFIDAAGSRRCTPAWDGEPTYPGAGRRAYLRRRVRAFRRRRGSDVVVSFGGAGAAELASRCRTVGALTKAYGDVIAAYGATHLDFDVEGAEVGHHAANVRRAEAVRALQRAAAKRHRRLVVTYTLATSPAGLETDALGVLRGAARRGVAVATVNGMTMDYGDEAAPDPAGRMGAIAVGSAAGMHRQLAGIFRDVSSAARWRRVGITPMLGVNDVTSEVFTPADAGLVTAFARRNHIGMLAMWSLGRDRPCRPPSTEVSSHCSAIDAPAWAFSRAFAAFRG